jgi:hypothetical protein
VLSEPSAPATNKHSPTPSANILSKSPSSSTAP